MREIFISYRREDAAAVRRLFDALAAHFGRAVVFVDLNIRPGSDFSEAIDARLSTCGVVLSLMGENWVNAMNPSGERRLEDPQDFVRLETASALQRNIPVLPVLVGGAAMPRPDQLPADLGKLAERQAFELTQAHWDADVQRLIEVLSPYVERPQHTVFPDAARKHDPAPAKRSQRRYSPGGVLGSAGDLLKRAGTGLRDLLSGRWGGSALPSSPPSASAPERPSPVPAPPDGTGGAAPAEPVLLGAAAPQTINAGGEFTARFVAYVAAFEDEVRQAIRELSPSSKAHLGLKTCQWQPGTRLKVTLQARQLEIPRGEQEFVWAGSKNLIEFDVTVPRDAEPGTVVLKFDVSAEGIVVATLRLDLQIAAARAPAATALATARGSPARTAFASYSLQDRLRVLDRVAAVRISAGLDVFVDCMSLHPGQEWEPQLEYQIRNRDLFLLFWSAAAGQSPWVTWEWRTALRERGKQAMQIHPLEADAKPPDELKDLHFGDVYMMVRKGQAPTAPASPSG